ncbi:hypothetical protein, partial [Halomonas sp. ND22Bw]|uniref:hypothetical protein n=1 Tax=Halomonas sp. ND22Bw TaxID=2054178 RepID=UPI001C63A3EB
DLFRGSANKGDKNSPPQLIGIPVEETDFFCKYFFTSTESRVYAQRAFLPEAAEAGSDGQTRVRTAPMPSLAGKFNVLAIPDGQAQH